MSCFEVVFLRVKRACQVGCWGRSNFFRVVTTFEIFFYARSDVFDDVSIVDDSDCRKERYSVVKRLNIAFGMFDYVTVPSSCDDLPLDLAGCVLR